MVKEAVVVVMVVFPYDFSAWGFYIFVAKKARSPLLAEITLIRRPLFCECSFARLQTTAFLSLIYTLLLFPKAWPWLKSFSGKTSRVSATFLDALCRDVSYSLETRPSDWTYWSPAIEFMNHRSYQSLRTGYDVNLRPDNISCMLWDPVQVLAIVVF